MTQITEGFDRHAWEPLAVASPLQSVEWLEVMSSRIPGVVHTVTHGDALGFLAAVISDPEAYESYNPHALLWRDPPVFELAEPAYRGDKLARMGVKPADVLPALVLVAPGYLGTPAGSAAEDPPTVRACLRDVMAWCRERGFSGPYVLYTDGAALGVDAAVRSLGGARFPLTTRWHLPVWWDSWEGYLAGLNSSRRSEIRRQLRRAEESGVRAGPVNVQGEFEQILDARCGLLHSYGQTADRAAEGQRLRGLLDTFGSGLTAYGAYQEDRLLSVSVCVRHGRSMHMVYTGSTEASSGVPYAHFIAAFYAVIQNVERSFLDEIDYGIGHGSGKELRGCQGRPMFGHVLAEDPEHMSTLARAAQLISDSACPTPV